MTALGRLLAELSEEDLAALAQRLYPYLPPPTPSGSTDGWLSVATVARELDCSPRTVHRRIAEGSLTALTDHGRA